MIFNMRSSEIIKPSLSVVMLTYNEIKSLRLAYNILMSSLKKAGIDDYEIIITTTVSPAGIHDGSPNLAIQISKENPRVKCVHSGSYQGMASDFRKALEVATKDYITMIPGSNVFTEESLTSVLSHTGETEGVVGHTVNLRDRPFIVRWVSRCFVLCCNILFFLNIKYYNGIIIFPAKFVRAVPMSARGGEYAAEIVVYLVKSGAKYIQVPQVINPIPEGGRTFSLRNVKAAMKSLILLFWKIHFGRKRINLDALRK